jgi:serine protease Do
MFGGLLGGVIAAMAVAVFMPAPVKGADSITETPQTALPAVDALSDAFAQVAEKASPAVVFIEIEKEIKGSPAAFYGPGMQQGDPRELFRQFFFGPGMGDQEERGQGQTHSAPVPVGEGSGFIISADGYIVTNNHVVGDADRVRVTLQDGRKFDAKTIGSDPQTEIALIKVDAKDLPTLKLGDSDKLRIGEWVLAIGNPFGLSHSVTSGIISAKGRGNVGIVDYADFIQTDAAINPGNSGGPLLNMRSEVIGMNTAIVSRAGGSDGVGFAVPVNMVSYIVEQLRDHGGITRGYLGISIQDLTPELAKWFGVPEGHGILVADVAKDSPAEKAGLQRDDVILEYNGNPIDEIGSFRSHISTTQSGKAIELTVVRKGERMKKSVEVGTLPSDHVASNSNEGEKADHAELGLAVQGLTDDIAKRLGYEGEHGVVVADVQAGSAAARAGIKPGMLIEEVNREKVNNPREFESAMKKTEKNRPALLLLREGQGTRYATLDIA